MHYVVKVVRRLAALPLLRTHDVVAGFNTALDMVNGLENENSLKESLLKLTSYVWRTYVDPVNARFKVDIWSPFEVDGKYPVQPQC